MKKIVLSLLAVAALASCAKNETIAFDKVPIIFNNAFVDNSTKAIYEGTTAVNSFTVWGNVTGNSNTVALYGDTGATVTNPTQDSTGTYGSAWTCSVTRYWTPSCTYKFAAIVDGTGTDIVNGLPTKISYTANGSNDLLYGEVTGVSTNENCVVSGLNNNNCVAFTMKHLLAKMYFDVTSSLERPYTIRVTGIEVSGIQQKGIYTINGGTWAKDGDTTFSLNFNNGAKVIIPVEQTLSVTITYDVLFDGTTISADVTKSGTIPATTYAENTVYKVSAAIGLNKIDFTISEVVGFGDSGEVTVQ